MPNSDSTAVVARRRRPRRLLQLLVAAAAVIGAVAIMAGPASATQTCTAARDANVCLSIVPAAPGRFTVHVGVDVHMSGERAQEYIDEGGPLSVAIYGDDGGPFDSFRFSLFRTSPLGASDAFGLSADFSLTVAGSFLDEDGNDGEDEIRARVDLIDRGTNTHRIFASNQLSGNWP
jgi:hypothetical protein